MVLGVRPVAWGIIVRASAMLPKRHYQMVMGVILVQMRRQMPITPAVQQQIHVRGRARRAITVHPLRAVYLVRIAAVVIIVPVEHIVQHVRQLCWPVRQPPLTLYLCPVAVGWILIMQPVHLIVYVNGILVMMSERNI